MRQALKYAYSGRLGFGCPSNDPVNCSLVCLNLLKPELKPSTAKLDHCGLSLSRIIAMVKTRYGNCQLYLYDSPYLYSLDTIWSIPIKASLWILVKRMFPTNYPLIVRFTKPGTSHRKILRKLAENQENLG